MISNKLPPRSIKSNSIWPRSLTGYFSRGLRWSKRRSKICSAMRFFSISTEPPAIIQPRQRRQRRPSALAQHLLAPRIDRIDAALIADLAQEFQRPAGRLAGIVRLPDQRDRTRRQQRLPEFAVNK